MKSLRIKNMKSFVDSGEIEIKPITIFVGKNGCGKSSLLRFPVVLAQTFKADSDSPIKFYGKEVDYGNFHDVLNKNAKGEMEFVLSYDIDVCDDFIDRKELLRQIYEGTFNLKSRDKSRDIRVVNLKVCLDNIEKQICVTELTLAVDNKVIYKITRNTKKSYCFFLGYTYNNLNFESTNIKLNVDVSGFNNFIPLITEEDMMKSIYFYITKENICNEESIKLLSNRFAEYTSGAYDDLSEIEKTCFDIKTKFDYCANLLRKVFNVYRNEASYTRYIGPFRANPERYYRDSESISHNVGTHGENTSNILIRDSRKKSKLLNMISEWTKSVLGYEIFLKDISNGMYQIMLRDENKIETNIIDNGYGVSQVLPIVTEVIRLTLSKYQGDPEYKNTDLLTIIEQPELHLHPAAQSELADLFVKSVCSEVGSKKLLIETHSEHLIRKIQILIARKDSPLTKDMVGIYYVDKDDTGNAFVEEMKIMDNGKFEEIWPSGFFDKGYILSRELARAGK